MKELVYGAYTPYEAFIPPPRVSRQEMVFRRTAKLCMKCGMAYRVHDDSLVCFECHQASEIEQARIQRQVWGIAA